MWKCLQCLNENSLSASFCAYCGVARPSRLESEDDLRSAFNQASASSVAHRRSGGRAPAILRIPDSSAKLIAAVIGITVGVLSTVLIFLIADPVGMTGRLFNLKNPFGSVPLSILVAFSWGLAICAMRYLRVRAEARLSKDFLLTDSIEFAKANGLEQLANEFDDSEIQYSPLLRRMHIVTRHWIESPGLQDADLLMQQQQYSDEENVRAGYSLVRTFVWALPVLGLLGTVAGVAVAIGGFAEFLGGDIEDVAVIKRSLVNVTAGLSYAFLTTLYGLAGALILMLIATALQGREEKLYTTIHARLANIFLPFLQTISPETKRTEITATSGMREELMAISASVLDYVRQKGTLTLQSFKDERNALREDVVQWGKLLREEASTGAQNIGQALDRVGMKMSNAQLEFLDKFETMKSGMDQNAASVLQSINTVAESASIRQQHTLETIAEQNAILQQNVRALSDITSVSQDAVKLISTLNNTLDSLEGLKLDERARDIVKVIEVQQKEVEASVFALNRSSEITAAVLASQSALHDSVRNLHETGFENTLREFRDSLTNLKPVLENLREPFILQAVPIKANGANS